MLNHVGSRFSKNSFLFLLILALTFLITITYSQSCPEVTPSTCEGGCNGGTCIRGVCSCPAGRIGERCEQTDRYLKAGNVVITQAGLDSAPIYYFKPINDAFEEVKVTSLYTSLYDGQCTNANGNRATSYRVKIYPITQSMFTKAELVQSSVRFEVINGGIRAISRADFEITKAKLDLWGGVDCCPCRGAGGSCTTPLCVQVCNRNDATDWISFSFSATVVADVNLIYSAQDDGVKATVSSVNLQFDDDSLGAKLNCPTGSLQFISNIVKVYFERMKDEIGPTLTPLLTTAIANAATRVAARYQGDHSYSPAPGIHLVYKVVSLATVPQQYISVNVESKLIYTHFHDHPSNCQINVTYADLSPDATLLPPPVWSPVTKVLSPSRLYSPVLAGARITRSFFNAVTWANFLTPSQRQKSFAFTTGNGLSAETELYFSVPHFKIPNDASGGRLRVSVDGEASFSCPPQYTDPLLSVAFSGLDSSFRLAYDNTPPDPSIAFQVIPRNFSVASITNVETPNSVLDDAELLKSAMIGAMNFKIAALDSYLLEKGNGVLTLPPDLQGSFPEAQLSIFSQGDAGGVAIDGESGYIEMIHRCACTSSPNPITGQGNDGVVSPCPISFLNRPYCRSVASSQARRLFEEDPSETLNVPVFPARRILTAQQDADLATVVGTLGTQCVTRSPTSSPTTKRPTRAPTRRPTRLPTRFDGVPVSKDVCVDGENGCYYERQVLFFVCPKGFEEKAGCRVENSDMYCCPLNPSAAIRNEIHVLPVALPLLMIILQLI